MADKQKRKKQDETRPILPIIFTLVTDGPIPGENNLLHVSAQFAPEVRWERNIRPQTGAIRPHSGIGPELQTALAKDAIPVRQAMQELVVWLDRFKGLRLPVTSAVGYWHLVYHLKQLTGLADFPLLMSPIDCNSFYAGAHGDLTVSKLVRGKDPWKAMPQRQAIIAEAVTRAKEGLW